MRELEGTSWQDLTLARLASSSRWILSCVGHGRVWFSLDTQEPAWRQLSHLVLLILFFQQRDAALQRRELLLDLRADGLSDRIGSCSRLRTC